jgi:hypothetical protein
MAQQLVARIKKSSKYSYQAPEGGWFDVTFRVWAGEDTDTYGIRGNNNDYRICDLNFGVRLDAKILPLK